MNRLATLISPGEGGSTREEAFHAPFGRGQAAFDAEEAIGKLFDLGGLGQNAFLKKEHDSHGRDRVFEYAHDTGPAG